MKTITESKKEKFAILAKETAREFLSKGLTMNDLTLYGEILKKEAQYQVENNTIGGLSNGKIV
jgi:hypothetical protein